MNPAGSTIPPRSPPQGNCTSLPVYQSRVPPHVPSSRALFSPSHANKPQVSLCLCFHYSLELAAKGTSTTYNRRSVSLHLYRAPGLRMTLAPTGRFVQEPCAARCKPRGEHQISVGRTSLEPLMCSTRGRRSVLCGSCSPGRAGACVRAVCPNSYFVGPPP